MINLIIDIIVFITGIYLGIVLTLKAVKQTKFNMYADLSPATAVSIRDLLKRRTK